jgi:two-component system, sensor histidine kinase
VTTVSPSLGSRIAGEEVYVSKDLSTSWPSLLVLKAGQILMAACFLHVLPIWMPLTWLGLVWLSGILHYFGIKSHFAERLAPSARKQLVRVLFCGRFACLGTAAFFLYVPNDLAMQCVLGALIVVVASLCVMQQTGDNWRGTVGAALVIVPTALRLVAEGHWLPITLGVGGFLVLAGLSFFGSQQQAALIEQAALRRRAEDAADAMAAVGIAKSRFFAAVSHDLRQPVHAIGLYLAPLLETIHEGRAKKGVDGIHQSWKALDGLLSQVLDLTRMDAGSLEAEVTCVEVAPLVRDLVIQHNAAAEDKSIRVVALVPTKRYVSADYLMLKRVLSNLLDNAIKFSPTEGCVVIALRPDASDWSIQVRDRGGGIETLNHEKIFEEFVQLDNPGRDRQLGLGLGLAIARRFVTLMGGRTQLRSALGRGTTVSVRLPKTVPPDEALTVGSNANNAHHDTASPFVLEVPESVRQLVQISGKAILFVEDDYLVAQAMVNLLLDLGLPLLHSSSAESALHLASQACLAACDVRLPGEVSGLTLALNLRELGIPSLLMTAETSRDVRDDALSAELMVLTKPVNAQGFLDALGRLAERKRDPFDPRQRVLDGRRSSDGFRPQLGS